MIEIKVPSVGESISEVTLLKWMKNNGELVHRDEVIAELESEKATFELNADEAGEWLQQQKFQNVNMLIKGSRSMQMEKVLPSTTATS